DLWNRKVAFPGVGLRQILQSVKPPVRPKRERKERKERRILKLKRLDVDEPELQSPEEPNPPTKKLKRVIKRVRQLPVQYSSFSLPHLHRDMIFSIVQYLDPPSVDIIRLSGVCRSLREMITQDDSFWRKIDLSHHPFV